LFVPKQTLPRQLEYAKDLLVIYTDGVTEAEDSCAREFWEDRLIETIRDRNLAPAELAACIQKGARIQRR
jgi:serine phosphatase RsbU (regulator of sigma subunit)